jgi:UDP-N-acetylglucosamine--N-acetylmuramyl-(pentapeptide) pyrophosphoryl-undecaprenol N-acetylglucosamine transferase
VDCWFATKNYLQPYVSLSWLIALESKNKRFYPDVVIGTGGFASGPLLKWQV